VDGGRGGLFKGAAAPVAGPAVRLVGQVLHEVAEMLPGNLRWLRPVVPGGEVEQAIETHGIVLQCPIGEGSACPRGEAAGLQKAGDELGERQSRCYQALSLSVGYGQVLSCSGIFRKAPVSAGKFGHVPGSDSGNHFFILPIRSCCCNHFSFLPIRP